jgi:hypothetical protein
MHWIKRGLVYAPDGSLPWAVQGLLTPTPVPMPGGFIRVYAGFRDARGVSRIGFVDVEGRNPAKVLRVSQRPVLDIGEPGTFDDNGLILGDLVWLGPVLRMYYVGFQLVEKVKFLAFTGLAESTDGGESFTRCSRAPVMGRADEGLFFRAIHSVLVEDGRFRVWYGCGSRFDGIDGAPFPNYTVFSTDSADGVSFPRQGRQCLSHQGDEYRIGRPRVFRRGPSRLGLFYTVGTRRKTYLPGYAESDDDGRSWRRLDDRTGLSPGPEGWDSQALSYPALLETPDATYLFHNGNAMGATGFGYAELLRP